LFLRDEFDFPTAEETTSKGIRAAALAELYGFPDLGLACFQFLAHSK